LVTFFYLKKSCVLSFIYWILSLFEKSLWLHYPFHCVTVDLLDSSTKKTRHFACCYEQKFVFRFTLSVPIFTLARLGRVWYDSRMKQHVVSKLSRSVLSLTREYRERGYFPSASVRIFDRDQTLAVAVAGDAKPESVFDVASLTKIATASQVFFLIGQNALSLDGLVLNHLPELSGDALLRERLGTVTLKKLLTHTSGLADWYPFYAESGNFVNVLHIALARCEPVKGAVYSDLNFMLLGKVIERAAGIPLEKCLQTLLVDPLGLCNMAYIPAPGWDIIPSCYGNPIEEEMCAQRCISFTGWRNHEPVCGEANDGNAFYFFNGVAGSAGIFAEPLAYQRLCQYYLNTDSPLFVKAQLEHAPTRGLGFQVGELYPYGCGHTGFTGTSIYLSRKLNIGVVAFTNRLFYKEPNLNSTNDFRHALHSAVAAIVQEI